MQTQQQKAEYMRRFRKEHPDYFKELSKRRLREKRALEGKSVRPVQMWSESEINFLKENSQKMRNTEIAKHLNRTYEGVSHKISRLGLLNSDNPRFSWTKKEIEFLLENYLVKTNKELGVLLGKTTEKINTKLKSLRILKPELFSNQPRKGTKSFLGKHHSEEIKARLAELNSARGLWKGNKNPSRFRRGKEWEEIWGYEKAIEMKIKKRKSVKANPNFGSWMKGCAFFKGKKHSEETKKKLKASWYHQNKQMGRNPNWRGGLSFIPYSLQWDKSLKRYVRESYDFTCQMCERKQNVPALDVHHIDYDKKNCDVSNLLPLCKDCHLNTNKYRDFWKKVLPSLVKQQGLMQFIPVESLTSQEIKGVN